MPRIVALFLLVLLASTLFGCGKDAPPPCRDEAVLLASTAGSPSHASCHHAQHRMHIEVRTTPSQEEIGAVVFCECVRSPTSGASAVPAPTK